MSMQLELLKLELDRVREERDRLRGALERSQRWATNTPSDLVHVSLRLIRELAAEVLDAQEAPIAEPCTHEEGDGVCSQCCNGEGS